MFYWDTLLSKNLCNEVQWITYIGLFWYFRLFLKQFLNLSSKHFQNSSQYFIRITLFRFCVVKFHQRLLKKSPFTKIHFWDYMRWQIGSGEYLSQKKFYWSLNVSSEVKQCGKTMTNEESENGKGYQSMKSRSQMGYSKCVHVRTIERKSQKIGHKVFAYKMDEL